MASWQSLIDVGLVQEDVSLGPLTTYKAGGNARFFAEIATREELQSLIAAGIPAGLGVLIVGRGSNLVVADAGFEGLAIKLSGEFSSIDIADGAVTAGAAVPLPKLARAVVDHGWTGLEFFVGVPGSVGGSVRQNAGCFGRETVDVLIMVTIIDLATGQERQREAAELELEYRKSNLKASDLVTSASFSIARGDVEDARIRMREVTRWRKAHQPGGTLNAGSVFKNPPGEAAGEIIDRLGLKGTAVGGVSVSEKHANFFVAEPGATAGDIAQLVDVVKAAVLAETGTMLEPEIQFVGFDHDH